MRTQLALLPIDQDIADVQAISFVPRILKAIADITGMRFTCIARVTEASWTVCAVYDAAGFGLVPGNELAIDTTFCQAVRATGDPVVFDSAAASDAYCNHPSPKLYGFDSYASLPLYWTNGEFFGTLCALDPLPATPSHPATLATLKLFAELISNQLSSEAQLQVSKKHGEALSLQLRTSEQERSRAWDVSQDLLTAVNLDGTFYALNAAWQRLLGWSEQEMIGTTFAQYVHPDDLEATQAKFAGLLEAPLTIPFEYRLRKKDGNYRWFAWTASHEGDRIYANGRDTQALHDQADALARSEASMRQMQKMEAVGQLTSGIAHDFNNLLAAITGSMEVMRIRLAQGRHAELERYVAASLGAARRAAALTHRLLAFSRQQTLEPKPIALNRLVAGMEELITRTVGPQIHVETISAGGLWNTFADESQLENALLNLCINARDAMPDGGRLTIETANRWLDERNAAERDVPPGQYISLCVSDNGSGMPPEVVARAFDPFFTTKPIGQGSGLGLSMVFGFARQSGGQIRIYSEIGDGTMVCIYLPRQLADEPAEPVQAAPPAVPKARNGHTILVVEDEPVLRMLIVDMMAELGYTTLEADNSTEGLRILQSATPISLMITDIGLPGGMNGRQMAEAALPDRPDLKVLFITGYAENAVFNHGHLTPGMQVLTKPFEIHVLESRVHAMIEQLEPAPTSHCGSDQTGGKALANNDDGRGCT